MSSQIGKAERLRPLPIRRPQGPEVEKGCQEPFRGEWQAGDLAYHPIATHLIKMFRAVSQSKPIIINVDP